MRHRPASRPRGRPPLPDAELVADIRALVANLPTYGYRRVHALLRRQAEKTGRKEPNPKCVYRVMKVHRLLLQQDGERREERRRDSRVTVDLRNTRWCSDGLEITWPQWRESACRIRARLLRPRGHGTRGDNGRHHRRGRTGLDGCYGRASLRTDEPRIRTHRVAYR